MAKTLLVDIETTPNLAYVWGKYQQDVIRFAAEWSLLSFSYKWMDETATKFLGRDNYLEAELVEILHSLFDRADIVIAHNGDKFDIRKVNAKFIEFGLDPPAPYKSVDTLKVAKRYFKFNSNKLDDLGTILGLGNKAATGGFDLWMGCMQGDKKAWKTMRKYNNQDVELLEQVYLKLRPWIDNHPGLNVIDGKPDACPKCGETRLQARGTRKTTKVGVYHRFQCQGCGGWCSSRKAERTEVKYTN
jgi:hypothetical protein